MDIAAVGDAAPLEQCPVAGQHDAAVAARQALDFVIAEMVVVDRVETGHAQQAGQAAEMGVGDEACHPQGPLAQVEQGADVDAFELRIDRNAVAGLQAPGEADRDPVDQDQFDLGMRHADRLDDMLEAGLGGAGQIEVAIAPFGGDEIVQLLVEPEAGRHHGCSLGGGWCDGWHSLGHGFLSPAVPARQLTSRIV